MLNQFKIHERRKPLIVTRIQEKTKKNTRHSRKVNCQLILISIILLTVKNFNFSVVEALCDSGAACQEW
jgi:hypothetical protein